MSGFRALERSLVAALRRGTVDYVDGVVVSTSPYRVLCTGEDEAAELIPLAGGGAVDDRVAALAVGPRRFGIPFAATAADLGPLATRVSALESTVNTGSNRNSLLRSDLSALTGRVSTLEAKVAALEADTGWLNLPPSSGWTSSGAQVRVRHGVVYLTGTLIGPVGTSYSTAALLPSAARPSSNIGPYTCGPTVTTESGTAFARITSSGQLQVARPSGSTVTRFPLGDISPYPA